MAEYVKTLSFTRDKLNPKYTVIAECDEVWNAVPLGGEPKFAVTLQRIKYNGEVTGLLAFPKHTDNCPCVFVVPGGNVFWGKNEDTILEYIQCYAQQGYVVLTVDFKYIGEREKNSTDFFDVLFSQPKNLEKWVESSVDEIRGGIDILHSLEQVDKRKTEIMGLCWGAHMATITAAVDNRIQKLVCVVPNKIPNEYNLELLNFGFFANSVMSEILFITSHQDKVVSEEQTLSMFDDFISTYYKESKQIFADGAHIIRPVIVFHEVLNKLNKQYSFSIDNIIDDLCAFWSRFLPNQVDKNENIFDLGASSHQLYNMINKLKLDLDKDVSVIDCIEHNTCKELGEFLMKAFNAEDETKKIFEYIEKPGSELLIVTFAGLRLMLGPGITLEPQGEFAVTASKYNASLLMLKDLSSRGYACDPTSDEDELNMEFWEKIILDHSKNFKKTIMLGNSMGATGALLYNKFASDVYIFDPPSQDSISVVHQEIIKSITATDCNIHLYYGHDDVSYSRVLLASSNNITDSEYFEQYSHSKTIAHFASARRLDDIIIGHT